MTHSPGEAIDPIGVGSLISDTYRRYLRSLLPLRDPGLASALNEQIENSSLLSKGPLLEATPPYATGATPRHLIDEGVLAPSFASARGPRISLDRPLYQHQERAIRKAKTGRNLIVATGTGSGKTESFLIPILNALEEEHAQGTLGPGVRAILLYPMNALANDQLKRLREELLAVSPHITFGRYTGETKEKEKDARELFRTLHGTTEPPPNELLSRERMRENPPHLLLTNYAMLEYLLLRPKDLDLFEGAHAGHWRFIALDEAHVYDGAKAAEIAMLLRRLRDRVAPDQRLQCIATSATVGDDPVKVTEFGTKLFDAPFEWVEDDPDRQDLVTATRRTTTDVPVWGPLPSIMYDGLAEEEDPGSALRGVAAFHGAEPAAPTVLLSNERRMRRLRSALARGPAPLDILAKEVFDGDPESSLALQDRARVLTSLVQLGSRVRDPDGTPVLSARYHLFTRATDGAFACLNGERPHVSLARHETCAECASPVFELGSCQRCGDVYLVGSVEQDEKPHRFIPQPSPRTKVAWLHLDPSAPVVDADEDVLEATSSGVSRSKKYLCTGCGALGDSASGPCATGCPGPSRREVDLLSSRGSLTARCLKCGGRGHETIRRFHSGGEASASVVATSLYQALPEDPDPKVSGQPGAAANC